MLEKLDQTRDCRYCANLMPAEANICTTCAYNHQTGKRVWWLIPSKQINKRVVIKNRLAIFFRLIPKA